MNGTYGAKLQTKKLIFLNICRCIVTHHAALEILAAFNANLKHYRDQILEELQNEKEIQIKW